MNINFNKRFLPIIKNQKISQIVNRWFVLPLIGGAILLTLLEGGVQLLWSPIKGVNEYAFALLSNLLAFECLHLYYQQTLLRGPIQFYVTFLLSFMIGSFNILIEALIFNVTSPVETILAMGQGCIHFFMLNVILFLLLNKSTGVGELKQLRRTKVIQWIWRVFAGAMLYLFMYLIAGMILQVTSPAIVQFYANKIPPMSTILITQIVRGCIFFILCYYIIKTSSVGKGRTAVLTGLLFAVLGGIAPLITVNEFMPAAVRLGHGFEVGITNFLYGIFLTLIVFPLFAKQKKVSSET